MGSYVVEIASTIFYEYRVEADDGVEAERLALEEHKLLDNDYSNAMYEDTTVVTVLEIT